VSAIERPHRTRIHPLHAFLLAATVPLFLGALLSDAAYARTQEIQWTNFASWLIAGGLVFAGAALLWAAVDYFRADRGLRRHLYPLVLLAAWVLGLVNAFTHAKDAWATMPEGLVLSVIVTVLACIATWLGFSGRNTGRTP